MSLFAATDLPHSKVDKLHNFFVKLKDESNYASWHKKMTLLFMGHKVMDIVLGEQVKLLSLPRQPATDIPDAAELDASADRQNKIATWTDRDIWAQSHIMATLSPEIEGMVTYCETLHEMWDLLEKKYRKRGHNALYSGLVHLLSTKYRDGDNMDEHITKLLTYSAELMKIGKPVPDKYLNVFILFSLPPSWSVVNTWYKQAAAIDEKVTIRPSLVVEHIQSEAQRRATANMQLVPVKVSSSSNAGALSANALKMCDFCNRKGHNADECKQSRKRGKAKSVKPAQSSNQEAVAFSVMSAGQSAKSRFIIDSGAWKNHTGDRTQLTDFIEDPYEAETANGEWVVCPGHGTLSIETAGGRKLEAKKVWYARGITLRSTNDELGVGLGTSEAREQSRAFHSGLSVHFKPDKSCTILRNGKFIASTIVSDGPYKLDIKQPNLALATRETVGAPLMLWHRRFGHSSPQTIIDMARGGAVQGLVLLDKLISDCLHCVLAKSKRSPFTIKATVATEILERVCIGLGFVPEPDHQGRTVYLAIVDQHSCGRWVFPLSSKSSEGVIEAFNTFRTSVENMTGKKIRFVRSDNGGEFTSKMFETYFKTNGIIHKRTAPYTLENNGQVERLNGSIMTTVKAMLHNANLPMTFWSYAMQAAVYLSNRTTVARLNGVTPYEIIFGKKPRVSHIKPFGAVAFVHIDGTLRTKLDDKAVEGILVGFNNYDYVVWLKDQQKEDSTVTPVEKEVPQQLVPVPDGYVQVQNGYQPGKYGELDMSNIIPYKHHQALFADRWKMGKTYLCISVPQGHFTPTTYEEAISCPDAKFWIIAIREELGALETHNVFEVSFLPDGAIALGSRWVFMIKLDAAGRIIRFKARLVAQGFAQRPGINFHETFAPVARMSTIRFCKARGLLPGSRKKVMGFWGLELETARQTKQKTLSCSHVSFSCTIEFLPLPKSHLQAFTSRLL
ncbi:BQ5605_C015g07736 [Microbotryum silenes-dioicae]|uniref:BQ5605_C015g07736 protein n=1 Tax=Microbotryum silenes-dioicae TaxID=796604 RepID=A0A2X0NX33_9BASI|nr:BQ5605_C015g07736 [Microbotryum silenes-dioicae]